MFWLADQRSQIRGWSLKKGNFFKTESILVFLAWTLFWGLLISFLDFLRLIFIVFRAKFDWFLMIFMIFLFLIVFIDFWKPWKVEKKRSWGAPHDLEKTTLFQAKISSVCGKTEKNGYWSTLDFAAGFGIIWLFDEFYEKRRKKTKKRAKKQHFSQDLTCFMLMKLLKTWKRPFCPRLLHSLMWELWASLFYKTTQISQYICGFRVF